MKADGPVALEFAAKGEHLAEVRRTVERLGQSTSLSRADLDDLLTAVDEAVANAIRHGSPQGAKSIIQVNCEPHANGLIVEIRDQGAGFVVPESPSMPGPDATGGRGLPLMVALSDAVEIASTPQGTAITLKKFA